MVVLMTMTWGLNAQIIFSDNFDSYSPGDLIAQTSSDWSTWSGGGVADDAPVTDEIAFSANNSLKFLQSGTGGPSDVVLPFGGKHEIGVFTYDMQMLIVQGNGAYFNFQGEEQVAQEWVAHCYFLDTGELRIANSNDSPQAYSTFPFNQWFHISFTIDLTNNQWVVSLDGTVVADFANPNNTIASIDIYPFEDNGGTAFYYVDDVAFSYEPPILPDWDAGVNVVRMRGQGMTGQVQEVKGVIKNIGVNTINSFDITWSDGTNSYTQSYSGYDIPSLASATFYHDDPYTMLDGSQTITVTVSNPNGMPDGNAANDTYELNMTGYTPAPDKAVLVEEGTGTWCTWCPRGAVFMDSMIHTYPDHFIGVAVHNGDPMMVPEYNDNLGIAAFPNIVFERESYIGFGTPADVEIPFLQRVTEAPVARLTNEIEYNQSTNELTVTVHAEFLQDVSGDYRLNAILIENDVTGTTSGYNQVNAYANNGNGWMGGFELLSSPVPASMMVYNDVGRALLGGFAGAQGSLPAAITAGETHSYTFTYIVDPAVIDMENTEVIGLITEPSGKCDNATKTAYDDFDSVVNSEEVFANHLAEVYPNPFSSELNVRLALAEATNVEMTVYNAIGAVVAQRDYGQLAGNQILKFNGANQANGIYYIHIKTDNYLITKKVQLQK